MFLNFLQQLKENDKENIHLIEAIEAGYKVYTESKITHEEMANVIHGIDILDYDLTPKTQPPIHDGDFKPEWYMHDNMEVHHERIQNILQNKIDDFKTDILTHYNINDIAELSDTKLKVVGDALTRLHNELERLRADFKLEVGDSYKLKKMDEFVDTNQEIVDDIYDITFKD